MESKGYLHEVGNSEVSEHIEWNAKRGGEVYQVRWGRTSWITNMAEVSEAAREARRSKETSESILETGVNNFHEEHRNDHDGRGTLVAR